MELGPRRLWEADLKQYMSVYSLGPNFSTLDALPGVHRPERFDWALRMNEPPSFCPFLCSFTEPVAQPTLQADNTTVTEDGSVTLTCLSETAGLSIRWLFNRQSLYFNGRMTLSQKNSQLVIDPVRMEDAGEYQCEVSNGYSSKTSPPVQMSVTSE